MRIHRRPVTGDEYEVDRATPRGALAGFYRAFNRRDHALMAANWLQTDEVSMANPLGGIRRGWREISAVYRAIFDGPARVHVEFHDYTLHVTDCLFLVAGRERGTLRLDGRCIDLHIRTTRIFTLRGDGWKQLHHHGSLDNPELLSEYQSVLLNKPDRRLP